MTDTPIDFEAFASTVLEPWFDPSAPQPDAVSSHTDPKLAAARALHAAVVEHRKGKGIIRLVATDAALARTARNYLEAYLEQPMLKGMVRKVTSDGVQLGSVAIEVTTNDLRLAGRDVLATIRLSAVTGPVITEPLTPPEFLRVCNHLYCENPNDPRLDEVSRLLGADIRVGLKAYYARLESEPQPGESCISFCDPRRIRPPSSCQASSPAQAHVGAGYADARSAYRIP